MSLGEGRGEDAARARVTSPRKRPVRGQSPQTGALARPQGSCLGRDHFGHHVAGVHVDGADGHDLHPVASVEVPDEQRDERVQLTDLQEQQPLRWDTWWRPPPAGWPRAGWAPGSSLCTCSQ